jgi:hypothetical protein
VSAWLERAKPGLEFFSKQQVFEPPPIQDNEMKAKKTIRGRTARRAKTTKAETPDDYLAGVAPDKRAALETLCND